MCSWQWAETRAVCKRGELNRNRQITTQNQGSLAAFSSLSGCRPAADLLYEVRSSQCPVSVL